MFDVRALFETDKTLELKGKEIQIGPKSWVTVARSNNTNYSNLISERFEQNQHVLRSKTPEAEERSDQILIEVMSKTILLGWRGDMGIDGEVLDYSQENAARLLAVKDFRAQITKLSDNFNNFKVQATAEIQGN